MAFFNETQEMLLTSNKDEFLAIYRENIKREGAKELLEFIQSTDYFTAPASGNYHSNFEGGLLHHSLNVYHRLKRLVQDEPSLRGKVSEESIAIIGLLHDLCKVNFYEIYYKNVKEDGVWVTRPAYKINEKLPYGHGEKSVIIIQRYMKLTDDEAMAINWHMGPYDDRVKGGSVAMNQAFHQFPLAFLTHVADSMATYIDEAKNPDEDD